MNQRRGQGSKHRPARQSPQILHPTNYPLSRRLGRPRYDAAIGRAVPPRPDQRSLASAGRADSFHPDRAKCPSTSSANRAPSRIWESGARPGRCFVPLQRSDVILGQVSLVLHSAIIVSLLLACLQAPFYHTHPAELDHGPGVSRLHFHLEARSHSGPAIEAPGSGDGALTWDWVLCKRERLTGLLAFAPEAPAVPAPAWRPNPQVRQSILTHDPPPRTGLRPRAPPA
jgi:hypothetical protein